MAWGIKHSKMQVSPDASRILTQAIGWTVPRGRRFGQGRTRGWGAGAGSPGDGRICGWRQEWSHCAAHPASPTEAQRRAVRRDRLKLLNELYVEVIRRLKICP